MVAASGDDKVNLVVSLLAKTEYGVPRTVARVNNPKNEWMFDEAWGVDVAVSTPRLMTALVEEAVSIGDLVRIFTFQQGQANMVELTLPPDSPVAGTHGRRHRAGPPDTVLVCIIREERPIAPSRDDTLEANDELMFVTVPESEDELQELLSPVRGRRRVGTDSLTVGVRRLRSGCRGLGGSAAAPGRRLRVGGPAATGTLRTTSQVPATARPNSGSPSGTLTKPERGRCRRG